ncbi:sulfotransferase family protein [Aliikangiella sp. IMCC44359]|uniref:sulfotransferase family protein n=1 Tax=Aliikangiella sp. IMCC44359 TaxID=3459125 RepID=UPI00403A9AEC
MVSNKFKCIFVHVPKTAGQSIELFFLKQHNLSWAEKDQLLLNKNTDPGLGPSRLAHMKANEYHECGHITKQSFDQYFKFAFVRNPWERLVSEYLHKKIDRHFSLKEFVFQALPEKNDFNDNYRHIIPQSEYLFDQNGQQLVNFIGRFENLSSDFNYICQQLNINNPTLPHRNSSHSIRRLLLRKFRHLFSNTNRIKKHYSQYYDEELYDHVGKIYAEDIRRFNYQFNCQPSSPIKMTERFILQDS